MRGTLANSFPLSEGWRGSAVHSAKRESPEGTLFEFGWTIHAPGKNFCHLGRVRFA
jgi:hypothetical protein